MRLLGRTLFIAVIVALLFGVFAVIRREAGRDTPLADLPLETRESVAYATDAGGELEFRLSGHSDQVRIRTHGLVPSQDDDSPGRTYAYALRIAVQASDGSPLAERIEHYRTTIVRFRHSVTGQFERINFVDDPTVDVIGTTLTILNLSGLPSAEVLRIRVVSADSDLKEVGIRVYEPEAIPEHSIAASWQRLSLTQRERLAEGNVYPIDLLTAEETAAILSRRWRPVGPTGIEGDDYRVRTLYIREEVGSQADRPLIPAGLYVDAQHAGSVEIAEPGQYLIRAIAVPGKSDEVASSPMLRLQQGAAPEFTIPWEGERSEKIMELHAGTLSVKSERPAAVRLYRLTPEDRIELQPSRRTTRAFRVSPADHLDYAVHRLFDEPAALRLDLRRKLDDAQDQGTGATTVTYSAFDAAGQVIASGRIEVEAAPAPDSGLVDDPSARLSAPTRRELALAPGIVRLRLAADRTVYVTAYSRLESDLPEGENTQDQWFSLLPVDGKQQIRDGGTIVVTETASPTAADGDDDE